MEEPEPPKKNGSQRRLKKIEEPESGASWKKNWGAGTRAGWKKNEEPEPTEKEEEPEPKKIAGSPALVQIFKQF